MGLEFSLEFKVYFRVLGLVSGIYLAMEERSNETDIGRRGGGLGSSIIFKNLMSPTPRRKWYLTTGRRAH